MTFDISAWPAPHFWTATLTVAVLTCGWVLDVSGYFYPKRPPVADRWASRGLFIGTFLAALSCVAGLIAAGGHAVFFSTPGPWSDHRFLGLWTSGAFVLLAFWRWRAKRRPGPLFTLVWMAAVGMLWAVVAAGRRLLGPFAF